MAQWLRRIGPIIQVKLVLSIGSLDERAAKLTQWIIVCCQCCISLWKARRLLQLQLQILILPLDHLWLLLSLLELNAAGQD